MNYPLVNINHGDVLRIPYKPSNGSDYNEGYNNALDECNERVYRMLRGMANAYRDAVYNKDDDDEDDDDS